MLENNAHYYIIMNQDHFMFMWLYQISSFVLFFRWFIWLTKNPKQKTDHFIWSSSSSSMNVNDNDEMNQNLFVIFLQSSKILFLFFCFFLCVYGVIHSSVNVAQSSSIFYQYYYTTSTTTTEKKLILHRESFDIWIRMFFFCFVLFPIL